MDLTIAYYGRQLNDNESTFLRNRNSVLRGSEEKEYLYSESNVPDMLKEILEKGLIKLLESKYPENCLLYTSDAADE